MRVFRFALALLLMPLLTSSVHAQASRTVSRTVDLTSGGAVTLETYAGSVDVQTWDREQARVDVKIEGEKQAPVENTKIRIESSGDRLEIETDYDELEGNQKLFGLFRFGSVDRPSTAYTLNIPRTTDLTVDTYSAATTVTRLEGDLHFDGYSASLTADRLAGSLRADTYSGNVEVGQIDGVLTVDSYSGRLRADSIAGTVQFDTYSGSASLDFAALAGDCSFNSYSGNVTIVLPSDAGAVINTERGTFETERSVRLEQLDDDRIRATLGDGGPHFRFDTFSGTLSVQ